MQQQRDKPEPKRKPKDDPADPNHASPEPDHVKPAPRDVRDAPAPNPSGDKNCDFGRAAVWPGLSFELAFSQRCCILKLERAFSWIC